MVLRFVQLTAAVKDSGLARALKQAVTVCAR